MYKYEDYKQKIFTDEGQREFLKVRDEVQKLLSISGAFMFEKLYMKISITSSHMQIAYIDRLVEIGEIKEISRNCATQHKIFIQN